jgi:hypothetical protein
MKMISSASRIRREERERARARQGEVITGKSLGGFPNSLQFLLGPLGMFSVKSNQLRYSRDQYYVHAESIDLALRLGDFC